MMQTIGTIMKFLSKVERDTLMAAFEEMLPGYLEYTPGRFIGVNIDAIPGLIVEQIAGEFREGRIQSTPQGTTLQISSPPSGHADGSVLPAEG